MKKSISTRQFASVKRIAMNVNPLVVKKNKLMDKINSIREEIEALNDEILGHEMGIRSLTGGLSSEELVIKTVVDKVDKNGSMVKITKYEPNTDVITFNEDTKMYDICINDESTESTLENNNSDIASENNNGDFQIDHFNL